MLPTPTPPPLSLALCALRARPARSGVELASHLGFAGVQLDATHPQTRPRQLDRSARRDLVALVRRAGLSLSGLDLLIPPEHLAHGPHLDRAADATRSAITLAADLASHAGGSALLCLPLPTDPDAGALASITAHADRCGVLLADAGHPPADREGVAVCLDVGQAAQGGEDGVALAASLGERLAAVRLADASPAGRVPLGAAGGRLGTGGVAALVAAASVAAADARWLLDCRLTPDPAQAAADGLAAWRSALGLGVGA